MAHYRLYLLGPDNQILEGSDVEAGDDDAACLHACAGLDGRVIVEVWCGTRYVRQVGGVL